MSFFNLLRENSFDWEKSKEIFYDLTDLRIAWINEIARQEKEKAKRKSEEEEKKNNRRFGSGTEVNKKSFDLRG